MEWIVVGTLISLGAGGIGLLIRSVRLRRELAELRSHLEVFTEASIRVADSLDELMRGNVEPPKASQASRRYVINQAREGMRGGEQLPQLSQRLGLSHDEEMLLRTTAA